MCFRVALKVTIYLGYFCKKIWCQEHSKFAQSGRTLVVGVKMVL